MGRRIENSGRKLVKILVLSERKEELAAFSGSQLFLKLSIDEQEQKSDAKEPAKEKHDRMFFLGMQGDEFTDHSAGPVIKCHMTSDTIAV